jgi:tRNA-splicing ligase RtcB
MNKISKNIYEIPKQGKMNVPGRIYASEGILKDIEKDRTIEQIKNVAALPGILSYSFAMPDAHFGYGFSIGGVAAFDLKKGIVSPGGVGFDINCGVKILKTNLKRKDLIGKEKILLFELDKKIPSGVGRGSPFQIKKNELKDLFEKGAKFIVEKGEGVKEDYLNVEEEGCIKGADISKVSSRAIQRGIGQLGTLGAGNHFLEVQVVDEIFDSKGAKVFGLEKGQILIMIHCGSRGLGHQVASDYIKLMEDKYGFKNLEDRQLVNAPIGSKLGKDYFSAMACAANFAFANRQLIASWVRDVFVKMFPKVKVETLYDICHNIAKIEEHVVDGKKIKVCVHRKGATRSFGPGRMEVPLKYRKVGQPVLIPGSMGTASYILVGTKKAEEISFGSTTHGAGRIMSRSSLRNLKGEDVKKSLEKKGINVKAGSMKSLAEEAPEAYKDIEDVVSVVHDLGLSRKVARLKPVLVVKG